QLLLLDHLLCDLLHLAEGAGCKGPEIGPVAYALTGRPARRVLLGRAGGPQAVANLRRSQHRTAARLGHALDAGDHAGDDRRGARGSAEGVCVPEVLVAAALQVA